MYKETFKERLRIARKKRDYTQEEAAKEIGISRLNITNYENGRTEPDIETLGKLIDLYQINANWLLGTGIDEVRDRS